MSRQARCCAVPPAVSAVASVVDNGFPVIWTASVGAPTWKSGPRQPTRQIAGDIESRHAWWCYRCAIEIIGMNHRPTSGDARPCPTLPAGLGCRMEMGHGLPHSPSTLAGVCLRL
jgi:hypothetical protein